MPIFYWSSQYEIGIKEIDEQHKQLVEIISDLFEAMRVGLGYKQVEPTIVKLKDYTIYHFSEEEKLMERINYPKLEAHKEAHKYFVETISEFEQRYKDGEVALTLSILEFLKNWLINHIGNVDKDIVNYMN